MVVSNTAGTVTSTAANLTVNRLGQTITFGVLPAKQTSDVTFTLGAASSSGLPVSYTSSNPGVATVSGNTVTIVAAGTSTITASQMGDATYSAATPVSQTLTVSPVSATTPTITTPPQSQTASVGTNVTLSVTAAGTAPLNYQWRKGGVNISAALGANYTITGVTTNHAGNYDVVVSNTAGTVTSTAAILTVNRLGQTITFGVLPAKQTSDVAFTLGAASSSGLPVSYTNSNPGVATVSGNTVTIVAAGTSTITASQMGDATYSAATPVSQTLTVGPVSATAPTITTPPQSQTVRLGTSVTFSVTATGATGYQWVKDGQILTGASGASYTIPSAQPRHLGCYQVSVSNAIGISISMSAWVCDE